MTNATNQEAANEIINAHMNGWNDTEAAHLDHLTGFAAWVYDVMQETRTALADAELEQLADDVVYSIDQDRPEVTVSSAQATAWLDENRAALIKALDAELAEQ